MEYLLVINCFIPKSAIRLTVGLVSTAMRRILLISFSQIRSKMRQSYLSLPI